MSTKMTKGQLAEKLQFAETRYDRQYWRLRQVRRGARALRLQIKELRRYLEQAALALEKLCRDNGDKELAFMIEALRRQAFPAKEKK